MFDVLSSRRIYHANEIDVLYDQQIKNSIPYVVRMTKNNGVRGYILDHKIYANDANTLSFAQDTFFVFYQKEAYFTGNKVKILRAKFKNNTENILRFCTICLQQSISQFSWGIGSTVRSIEKTKIKLPIQNDKIDFDFMERFIAELEADHIAELEAYLQATGLNDYTLTAEEERVLKAFENGEIIFREVRFQDIFNNIAQGKRLKKEDQKPGNLPFVMAGTTNTGVVNYISNPVESFPENSITIDIFGNTFYRNYPFGAGDDTGVYWEDQIQYSKEMMLFFSTCMGKSINGKFSYGKKLRSSQSLDFKMKLPLFNDKNEYDTMETLISAIQKMVIKDVVLYSEQKMTATRQVVAQ